MTGPYSTQPIKRNIVGGQADWKNVSWNGNRFKKWQHKLSQWHDHSNTLFPFRNIIESKQDKRLIKSLHRRYVCDKSCTTNILKDGKKPIVHDVSLMKYYYRWYNFRFLSSSHWYVSHELIIKYLSFFWFVIVGYLWVSQNVYNCIWRKRTK